MRLIVPILLVVLVSCAETEVPFPPDVDYSDGPVVTMASTTHLEIINNHLEDGMSVSKAHAVRSESHDFAHFIAARIDGIDDGERVGLWFMYDGMDVPGEAFSVNDIARRGSSFPVFEDASVVDGTLPDEVHVLLDLIERLPQTDN